jgi:hypothetical protein
MAVTLDTRKILFFTASQFPTAAEISLMLRIRGDVKARNAAADCTYGTRLEAADGLAGSIPASYLTGEGSTVDTAIFSYGDVTPTATDFPEDFDVFPPSATLAALDTLQLYGITADLAEDTGLITMTDISSETEVAWASSDETKATVDTDGVVTAVASGTATITATYTYATEATTTATCAITVS